jgi:hypothetical protein
MTCAFACNELSKRPISRVPVHSFCGSISLSEFSLPSICKRRVCAADLGFGVRSRRDRRPKGGAARCRWRPACAARCPSTMNIFHRASRRTWHTSDSRCRCTRVRSCQTCVTFCSHASLFGCPIHKKITSRQSMLKGRHTAIIQRTVTSRFSSQHGLFRRQGKGESPRVMNVAAKVAIKNHVSNTSEMTDMLENKGPSP